MQRYFFETVDNFFCVFLAYFLQLQKIILHLCVNKETAMKRKVNNNSLKYNQLTIHEKINVRSYLYYVDDIFKEINEGVKLSYVHLYKYYSEPFIRNKHTLRVY